MTIIELRAKIGNEMGLGGLFSGFAGTAAAYSQLTAAQQIELTNRMKAYIREHPAEFTTAQQTVAATPDVAQVSAYSVADAFGDFSSAVADEAVSINEAVNPFSAANRGWVLGVVAVGVILYFAAPAIVQALRAPAKAAS